MNLSEMITLVKVPVSEISGMIASGGLNDAKSIAGLLTFLENRKTLPS